MRRSRSASCCACAAPRVTTNPSDKLYARANCVGDSASPVAPNKSVVERTRFHEAGIIRTASSRSSVDLSPRKLRSKAIGVGKTFGPQCAAHGVRNRYTTQKNSMSVQAGSRWQNESKNVQARDLLAIAAVIPRGARNSCLRSRLPGSLLVETVYVTSIGCTGNNIPCARLKTI